MRLPQGAMHHHHQQQQQHHHHSLSGCTSACDHEEDDNQQYNSNSCHVDSKGGVSGSSSSSRSSSATATATATAAGMTSGSMVGNQKRGAKDVIEGAPLLITGNNPGAAGLSVSNGYGMGRLADNNGDCNLVCRNGGVKSSSQGLEGTSLMRPLCVESSDALLRNGTIDATADHIETATAAAGGGGDVKRGDVLATASNGRGVMTREVGDGMRGTSVTRWAAQGTMTNITTTAAAAAQRLMRGSFMQLLLLRVLLPLLLLMPSALFWFRVVVRLGSNFGPAAVLVSPGVTWLPGVMLWAWRGWGWRCAGARRQKARSE